MTRLGKVFLGVLAIVVVMMAGCQSQSGAKLAKATDVAGMSVQTGDVTYVVSAPQDKMLVCRVVETDPATGKPNPPKAEFCKRVLFLPDFVVFEDVYSHGKPAGWSTTLSASAVHNFRIELSDVTAQ